jgi:hypothetical protein
MPEVKSEAVVKEIEKIVMQYNDGAIFASEAIYAIVNRYVENCDAIAAEHKQSFELLNTPIE